MKRAKSPVAIRGKSEPDMISQDDLYRTKCLQEALWAAGRAMHSFRESIQTRLLHGATIQEGTLTFDRESKMVVESNTLETLLMKLKMSGASADEVLVAAARLKKWLAEQEEKP